MSEMNSIFREFEAHERPAYLRDRARRENAGVASDRERRRLFRKVTRHRS
jgi:hypothetical protein